MSLCCTANDEFATVHDIPVIARIGINELLQNVLEKTSCGTLVSNFAQEAFRTAHLEGVMRNACVGGESV